MRDSNRCRFAFVCQGVLSDDLLYFLSVKAMESCTDADGTNYCYVCLSKRLRVSRLSGCIHIWNNLDGASKITVCGDIEVFAAKADPQSPILTRIRDERRKTLNREESTYRAWTSGRN